jgi:ABC-type glycerol-3-phosphate transport system substrate-binding protein
MRPYSRLLLASGAVLAIACSAGSTAPSKAGSPGSGGSTPNTSMSATINDTAFVAIDRGGTQDSFVKVKRFAATTGDTEITVVGGTRGFSIGLVFFSNGGPGTRPMVGTDITSGSVITPSATWTAAAGARGSSGSITVDSINATRITGTFQYLATPDSTTTAIGTKNVTNGKFAVPFRDSIGTPSPN